MALSPGKKGAVERLMQATPDALLSRLGAALLAARLSNSAFAPVSELARAEAEERRCRDTVLEPLKLLADRTMPPPKKPMLGPGDLARIWRVMKAVAPKDVAAASQAALALYNDHHAPPAFDLLCRRAAAALAGPDGAGLCPEWSKADREHVILLLRLTPALRAALPLLPDWTHNVSSLNIAIIRLSFKDALAISDDAAPLYMEALQIHLEDPFHILRIISAVEDKPSDRYLAASEMAGLCGRMLQDIERRVLEVRNFDANRGGEAGAALAASVSIASNAMKEFEQCLSLSKDGPWGSRIIAQKLGLATAAEALMKEAERAVAKALPVLSSRAGGPPVRPLPRIDDFPDAALVRKAEGLLAFIEATYGTAPNAGFGAMRNKVIENLETRLSVYVEDLMDLLRAEHCSKVEEVRAHFEIAATYCGLLSGPQVARNIRRRIAAI